LPGGHVEEDDKNLEETLKREILEEIGAELLDSGVIGYEKVWWHDSPKDIYYYVRYWAKVRVLNSLPNDPDGKALERLICSKEDAMEKLGYGEKGKILLKLAYQKI
jgi:8-oxo-dGTP pyrophosphatase MutT (NUDIX family)